MTDLRGGFGTYDPDQWAVVVGAAGGTGLAICRALGHIGVSIVAADIDREGAARVAATLTEEGTTATSMTFDVTDRSAVDAAAATLADTEVTVLVNLAGTLHNRRVVNMTDDEFDRTMASHMGGTRNTTRAFAPAMSVRGFGRIVNMSSIVVAGAVGAGAYGAAKAAIEAFSRTAALELASHGITVNCVASGPLATGMFLSQPQENQARIIDSIPMKRAGTPEEMAAVVAFLASPSAAFITGQSIVHCGGLSLGF